MHRLTVLGFAATSTFVFAAFAGCLLPGEAGAYRVYGTQGSVAVGWAYDGKAIVPFGGDAYAEVNEADNTGAFVAKGSFGGQDFRVVFEDFAEQAGKPFQKGGIAGDFHEHGASGTGDASIPEVDLEMAGWGFATIHVGGQPYKDPVAGKDQWAAHFMVIRHGVRDNASGAIYSDANKSQVYDPKNPSQGAGVPGDYELHLVLKNQTGNASAPQPFMVPPYSTPSTMLAQTHNLFVANVIGSTAEVELTVGGTAVTASNVTFTIKAPSGAVLLTRSVGPNLVALSPTTAKVTIPVKELGQYTVSTTGRLLPLGSYSIRGVVQPPAQVVLNLWWEDLTFGAAASQKASDANILEGTRLHGEHEHETGTASPTPPGNDTRPARVPRAAPAKA